MPADLTDFLPSFILEFKWTRHWKAGAARIPGLGFRAQVPRCGVSGDGRQISRLTSYFSLPGFDVAE